MNKQSGVSSEQGSHLNRESGVFIVQGFHISRGSDINMESYLDKE